MDELGGKASADLRGEKKLIMHGTYLDEAHKSLSHHSGDLHLSHDPMILLQKASICNILGSVHLESQA